MVARRSEGVDRGSRGLGVAEKGAVVSIIGQQLTVPDAWVLQIALGAHDHGGLHRTALFSVTTMALEFGDATARREEGSEMTTGGKAGDADRSGVDAVS